MTATPANLRTTAATALLLENLEPLKPSGSWILVDDESGEVGQFVGKFSDSVEVWNRRASAGQKSSAWIPAGSYAAGLVRLPKSREAQDMVFHAVLANLEPGGQIWVYGANDEGIKSIEARLESLCGNARTVAFGNHSRVLAAHRPSDITGLKSKLSDWRQVHALDIVGRQTPWVSYPGTFADGRVDEGTAFLLDHLPALNSGMKILDFGAGCGMISAVVHQRQPGAELVGLEIDSLAVEAAKENVPTATWVLGTGLPDLGNRKFNLILSNPPFHDGKGEDLGVLTAFLKEAPASLLPGGSLRIVVQKHLRISAKSFPGFKFVSEVAANGKFRIWQAGREGTGIASGNKAV